MRVKGTGMNVGRELSFVVGSLFTLLLGLSDPLSGIWGPSNPVIDGLSCHFSYRSDVSISGRD